jgi:hypothetical protein
MYIELGAGGRILAAYLDQQYPGQRWLPIDSRALQTFLATAPTVARDVLGRRGFRRLWRSGPAYHVAAWALILRVWIGEEEPLWGPLSLVRMASSFRSRSWLLACSRSIWIESSANERSSTFIRASNWAQSSKGGKGKAGSWTQDRR